MNKWLVILLAIVLIIVMAIFLLSKNPPTTTIHTSGRLNIPNKTYIKENDTFIPVNKTEICIGCIRYRNTTNGTSTNCYNHTVTSIEHLYEHRMGSLPYVIIDCNAAWDIQAYQKTMDSTDLFDASLVKIYPHSGIDCTLMNENYAYAVDVIVTQKEFLCD